MATNASDIKQSFDPEKLWRAFLDGDVKAYEKMFKYYYRDLYGYGLNFCKKPELVKDCIQDIFVEIGKGRSNLSAVKSIKAYLLVSLRRMILKKLEKERGRISLQYSPETEGVFQVSPEDIIINREISLEQSEALKIAIQSLPDRQKEVLVLRYFNGMSYGEIEEILSINYQSIRNHIYRATKRLRKALESTPVSGLSFPQFSFTKSRVGNSI